MLLSGLDLRQEYQASIRHQTTHQASTNTNNASGIRHRMASSTADSGQRAMNGIPAVYPFHHPLPSPSPLVGGGEQAPAEPYRQTDRRNNRHKSPTNDPDQTHPGRAAGSGQSGKPTIAIPSISIHRDSSPRLVVRCVYILSYSFFSSCSSSSSSLLSNLAHIASTSVHIARLRFTSLASPRRLDY